MHKRLLFKLMMLSTTWVISLPCQASVISAKHPAYAVIYAELQIASKSKKNIQLNQYFRLGENQATPNPSLGNQSLLHLATNKTLKQISQTASSDPDGSAEDAIVTPHGQPLKQTSAEWYDEFRMPEAERQMLLREYVKELATDKTELPWPNNKCRSKKDRIKIATGLLDIIDKVNRPLEITGRENRLTPDLHDKIQAEIYRAYKTSYLETGASGGCLIVEKEVRESFLNKQESIIADIASRQTIPEELNTEIDTYSNEDMPLSYDAASQTEQHDLAQPKPQIIDNRDPLDWTEEETKATKQLVTSYALYQVLTAFNDASVLYINHAQLSQTRETVKEIENKILANHPVIAQYKDKIWIDAEGMMQPQLQTIRIHGLGYMY